MNFQHIEIELGQLSREEILNKSVGEDKKIASIPIQKNEFRRKNT